MQQPQQPSKQIGNHQIQQTVANNIQKTSISLISSKKQDNDYLEPRSRSRQRSRAQSINKSTIQNQEKLREQQLKSSKWNYQKRPPFIVENHIRKLQERPKQIHKQCQAKQCKDEEQQRRFQEEIIIISSQIELLQADDDLGADKIFQIENNGEVKFYTGYAECKNEQQKDVNKQQMEVISIEEEQETPKKKRKYVQRKLWKGICPILDRRYQFDPEMIELFDQEELSNPMAADECRLWKTLMNKYITDLKLERKKKKNESNLKQEANGSLSPDHAKKKYIKKKSMFDPTTSNLLKKSHYIPPFKPIMLADFKNLPTIQIPVFQIAKSSVKKQQQVFLTKNNVTDIKKQDNQKIETHQYEMIEKNKQVQTDNKQLMKEEQKNQISKGNIAQESKDHNLN